MAEAEGVSTPAGSSAGLKPGDPIDIPESILNPGGGQVDQASIDDLLQQVAEQTMSSQPAPSAAAAPPTQAAVLEGMQDLSLPDLHHLDQDVQASGIDMLRDVDLHVKIELGRSRMYVEDVLKLSTGSVVELDKLAGDPVDVFVNDRLVARGEVLVLNDNFCVRINEIVAAARDDGN